MRVKYAVPIDTAITECGSMKMSQAFCSARSDAPSPAAFDATLTWKIPATWVTRIMPNTHPAACPVRFRPTPFQRKSGRYASPARFQNTMRTRAWAATPRVALPASRAMRPASQTSTDRLTPSPPKTRANTMRPAIATTLLSTGAHVNGPKAFRALSTSPRRL